MPVDLAPPFRAYAGVGSRETPTLALEAMTKLAADLARAGWTLRSGAAPGADRAFEKGCDSVGGQKQVFLPWSRFEGSDSEFFAPPPEAYLLAAKAHLKWDKLSGGARALHARNAQQVLGPALDSPSAFVVCWTSNGYTVGGTATAIRLAESRNIPVWNMGKSMLAPSWLRAALEQR